MTTYSVTERLSFLRCKTQHSIGSFNRMSIEPIHGPQYFQTGTLWHKGQERWCIDYYNDAPFILPKYGDPPVQLEHMFDAAQEGTHTPQPLYINMLQVANEIKAKVRGEYKLRVGCEPEDSEFHDLYEAMDNLLELAQRYEVHWGTPIPDGFKLLAPEQTFIVDVPYSEHQLEGTLDGLLERTIDGALFILERKTYSQRSKMAVLNNTQQFTDYAYLVTQTFPDRDFGGLAYDGVWVSKANHTNDELFLRTTIHKSKEEIERAGIAIGLTLNEMEREADNCSVRDVVFENRYITEYKSHYVPHPVATRDWKGCYCAFDKLCEAYHKGQNWQAIVASDYRPRPKQGFASDISIEEI